MLEAEAPAVATVMVTLQGFLPLRGQYFDVLVEPGLELAAELVEAQAIPSGAGSGREPFSLVFKGPAQPVLPQRTYRMKHQQGALAVDMFIVPVRGSAQGVWYEAVYT